MNMYGIVLVLLMQTTRLITAKEAGSSGIYENKGLNPRHANTEMRLGCELENVNIIKMEEIPLKTFNDDNEIVCKEGCIGQSQCVAGSQKIGSTTCDFYKTIAFTTSSVNPRARVFLSDCRLHICADSCHCYDGDTRDIKDCKYFMDEEVTLILQNSEHKLVLSDFKYGKNITLSAQVLDAMLATTTDTHRENVEAIVLRTKHIAKLITDVFANMKNLRYLNLDDNKIQEISSDMFFGLRKLEALMLVNNRITDLQPGTFRHLKSLKYLDLSGNPVIQLRNGLFSGLDALETLHLKANSLFQLDEHVFKPLANLRSLTITGGASTPDNPYPSYDPAVMTAFRRLTRMGTPVTYNPILLQSPKEKFDKLCIADDCYKQCEDIHPNYLSSNGVVYDFRFDLTRLSSMADDTVVHAQTAFLRKGAKLKIQDSSEWFIYTRELYIDGTVEVSAKLRGSEHCSVGIASTSRERSIFHFNYNTIHIYAEKIYIRPGTFHVGLCGFDIYMDELDDSIITKKTVSYVEACVKCAELLSYSNHKNTSVEMLDFANALYSNKWTRSITVMATMFRSNLLDRWRAEERGSWFVPPLSLNVYKEDYSKVANEAQHHHGQYKQLMMQNDHKLDWTLLYGVMGNMTYSLKKVNNLELKNSRDVLSTSEKSLKKIQIEYKKAMTEAHTAQTELLAGIRNKLIEDSLSLWENAFNGVLTLFSAVKSLDFVSVFWAGKELWDGFQDHMDSIDTMNDVTSACADMMKMLASGKMDVEKVEVYLKNLDKASTLEVRIVEWDLIPGKINSMIKQLGSGVDGLDAYEYAIERLASWGKRLTEETIAQAHLVREFGERAAMGDARSEQVSTVGRASSAIAYARGNMVDQLTVARRLLFEMRLELLELMAQYCQAYHYYYLHPCQQDDQPNAHDDLDMLIRKALWAEGQSHRTLSLAMMQPPQRFEESIIIEDAMDARHCNSSKYCRISTFIKTKAVTYTIPLDHPKFETYDRVRVEEVQVHFIGVTGTGAFNIVVRSSPNFLDRVQDNVFTFTTSPRTLTYKYDIDAKVVNTHGTVHDEYDKLYSDITAFTEWTISYDEKYNRGIDFSAVSKIELVFKGNAVSRAAYMEKRQLL